MAITGATGLGPGEGRWRGWRTGKDIPRRAKTTVATVEVDIERMNPRVVRSLRNELRRLAADALRMKHYKAAASLNASIDSASLTAKS